MGVSFFWSGGIYLHICYKLTIFDSKLTNICHFYDRSVSYNVFIMTAGRTLVVKFLTCVEQLPIRKVVRVVILIPSVIAGKKFKRSFKGYDCRQVDEFLNEIIQGLDKLHRENALLKKQHTTLTESIISMKNQKAVLAESNASLLSEVEALSVGLSKYKDMEHAIQNSLVSSQEMSDEILRSAAHKAEILEQEARTLSKELVEKAERERETVLEQATRAKRDMEAYRQEMKSSLMMSIEYLHNLDAESECIDELWVTPHTLGRVKA